MIQLLKSEIIKEKLNEEIENDVQIKKKTSPYSNKSLYNRKIVTLINNND